MTENQSWTSEVGAAADGAVAREVRDGCLTAARFDRVDREYRRVRETVAVSDASHYGKFRVAGRGAVELLDRLCMTDVSRVPIQKAGVTLLLEADGRVLADAYVYNRGADYLLLTEGRPPAEVAGLLDEAARESAGAEVSDLTRARSLIDVSGPYAWELLKELAGVRVVGLRYMEAYDNLKIDGLPVTVLRAGKTGEFGYLIMAEAAEGPALWSRLVDGARAFKGAPCGTEVLDLCRMENRFLNPRREGAAAANPLELNYRVMVSRDKPDYVGREAVDAALATGPARRVVGVAFEGAGSVPPVGASVVLGGERVGTLVNASQSLGLGYPIGLALIDAPAAYVGLEIRAEGDGDGDASWDGRTVSAPFLMNRSLAIRPNEHSFHADGPDTSGLDD